MDDKIRNAKDLTGKVVAVQTGTSYLEQVKKVSGVKEVKNFPQDTDAQRALDLKRVDAWVSDKFVAKEAAAKNAKAGFKLGDMLFIERIAPPWPRATPAWPMLEQGVCRSAGRWQLRRRLQSTSAGRRALQLM